MLAYFDFDFTKLPLGAYVWLAVVDLLIIGAWVYTHRLPAGKKGLVALAVAISTEDDRQQRRIKADFIDTLRKLVDEGTLRYRFQVVEVPDFVTAQITCTEDALRYACRASWHFMLFGRARLRMLGGKEHHVLNLEGLVRHRPLTDVVSRQLATEFSELMPRDIKIEAENDLLAFEFTAEYVAIVAQYVIGIAAFLSGDLDYAQSLFERVRLTLTARHANIIPLQKIKQRLPTRLAEVFGAQASLCHKRWREDRNRQHYEDARRVLDRLAEVDPDNYSGHLLRALSHFVVDRDVDAAIREIRKCKELDVRDATWRLSYAFLLAYRGELQQARKQYQIAFRCRVQPKVLVEVEEFILWVLEEEPDTVQLHYCLGLVNYAGKDDPARALEEFAAFRSNTSEKNKALRQARRDANAYVQELRQRLGTERLPE